MYWNKNYSHFITTLQFLMRRNGCRKSMENVFEQYIFQLKFTNTRSFFTLLQYFYAKEKTESFE